jgi:hypothetical protein
VLCGAKAASGTVFGKGRGFGPTLRIGTSRDGKPLDTFSIYIEPYERILNNDYPGLLGKERLELDDLIRHETEVAQLETKLATFAWGIGGWRAAQKDGA